MFQLLFIKMRKSNSAIALLSMLKQVLSNNVFNLFSQMFGGFFSVFQVNMKYNPKYIKKTYEEIYM